MQEKSKPKKQIGLAALIGTCLFIRTVTYHLIGRVTEIKDGFISLEEASWIADSGRFHNAIKEGTLSIDEFHLFLPPRDMIKEA